MKPAVIFLLILFGGCQPAFIDGVPNENSPYFQVPVESRFVLQRALVVPAREHSAFQQGRNIAWHQVSIYSGWCVLQLDSARAAAHTVEPDTFVVRQVSNEHRYHLAALDMDRGDSETYEVLATVMHLQSAHQPQVTRLVCAEWGLPQGHRYLTVQNIRRILGAYFELELAPSTR